MAKKVRSINLLRNQEKSVIDKFLDWAFTVGRAIVIVTESIALCAFAYRFVLDRQIIDLKDKIKQEQAIVKLSQPNEFKFRNLQSRLAVAQTLDTQSSAKTLLLNRILEKASGKVSFDTIGISDKAVTMEGVVSSPQAVSAFASDLRLIPGVTKVNVGNITNNTATGALTISVEAALLATTNDENK